MICEAFHGKVYETPPVVREKGTGLEPEMASGAEGAVDVATMTVELSG